MAGVNTKYEILYSESPKIEHMTIKVQRYKRHILKYIQWYTVSVYHQGGQPP